MKRAFTLIEMLVVLGIVAVLIGTSIAAYSRVRKSAERAKARELCLQVKTAFEAIWDQDGVWPKTIRQKNNSADSVIDENVAYELARRGVLALTYDSNSRKTTGLDRFGILSPWGADAARRSGSDFSISTKVGPKATIKDHLLCFKVDLDGDGIINDASVGGESVDIRGVCAVWCAGKDGKMESYQKGLKSDDIYTWTPGQTKNVK